MNKLTSNSPNGEFLAVANRDGTNRYLGWIASRRTRECRTCPPESDFSEAQIIRWHDSVRDNFFWRKRHYYFAQKLDFRRINVAS